MRQLPTKILQWFDDAGLAGQDDCLVDDATDDDCGGHTVLLPGTALT